MSEPVRSRATETGLLLAGSGGLADEARASHEGRRALLLTRESDVDEMIALAQTMGLVIVETVLQRGEADPRTFLGSGRLEMIGDDLRAAAALPAHDWHGIDLVLVHHNLAPRQLVNIHDVLGVESWDRVRLLLELFTVHAASVEARTQVRIARLGADRAVLRELVSRETTGERAGWGAGGRHADRAVLEVVNREMASLRRRQARHTASRDERRRQRIRSGAFSVGLAGYTNAGKSSLFRALCGKEVLVQDKLFSTLETTVGRMQRGPRVLLVDTIGFIDRLPSSLLDAFGATLAESLECDLLLLLVDASDEPAEIARRLDTSRRELFDRIDADDFPMLLPILTKTDLASTTGLAEARRLIADLNLPVAIEVSSHTGEGIEDLRESILTHLHGKPVTLRIRPPSEATHRPLAALIAHCHEVGEVIHIETQDEASLVRLWMDEAGLGRLLAHHPAQVELAGPPKEPL